MRGNACCATVTPVSGYHVENPSTFTHGNHYLYFEHPAYGFIPSVKETHIISSAENDNNSILEQIITSVLQTGRQIISFKFPLSPFDL